MSYGDNEMCNNCDKLELLEFGVDDLVKALDLQNMSEFAERHIITMEEITREWRGRTNALVE